jgi:hypothetical protein
MKSNRIFGTYKFVQVMIIVLVLFGCGTSIKSELTKNKLELEDGLYLIERSGTKRSDILPLKSNEKIITFNEEFIDRTVQEQEYLVVNVNEFAPLELSQKPSTETQFDNRKKLFLKMSDRGKLLLKDFTANNLNSRTAIVVNNEALTQHKIRMVIEDGALQITRCTDNACEFLFVELEDNVVKN